LYWRVLPMNRRALGLNLLSASFSRTRPNWSVGIGWNGGHWSICLCDVHVFHCPTC
jgi:hypothetical protein